jgi:hypothetical protein
VKFDDQLAAYLYENKTLKLEGIGIFTLAGNVSVPHENEKEIYYPIEGLSFNYNPKSDIDETLITFLVKKLGKIQPLVRSDLESYLSNIKQFINLGKPYTIEGIGTLSKNNQGTYEFTPGNFLPVKEELNPRRENAEHNYPVRSQGSAGKIFVVILIVIAALAVLGGIGWGVSNLLAKQRANVNQETQTQGYSDTIPQPDTNTATTTDAQPPATSAQPAVETGDSVRYKMIFEITRLKERAINRTRQLNTLRSRTTYDTIRVNDSLRYRLFLPVRIRPIDTVRYKDSLRIFFGNKIRVERQ